MAATVTIGNSAPVWFDPDSGLRTIGGQPLPASVLALDIPAAGMTAGQVAGAQAMVSEYGIGLVATRCSVMANFAESNKQTMSRSAHTATEAIESLQLVYANWYAQLNIGDTGPGAAATFSASVEYPAGTITPVKFSGASSVSIASGANAVSDATAVVIPRGATFWVRTFQDTTAGILYSGQYAADSLGEWTTFGVTTTNYVNSAINVSKTQAGVVYRPTAIIGRRTREAFGILGDSRTANGTGYDAQPNSFGGLGEVERSLVKLGATINCGCSGESASSAAGTQADKRVALINAYCTRAILSYGINDCIASAAAATTAGHLVTVAQKLTVPAYVCTITPKSASTDSWATTANQTTDSTANPRRVTLNGLIRAGLGVPFIGSIELADYVESARDSGLWKVTGAANAYTSDGLHGNAAGHGLIESSPAFIGAVRL